MPTASFAQRRSQLEAYFDRTAVDAWALGYKRIGNK